MPIFILLSKLKTIYFGKASIDFPIGNDSELTQIISFTKTQEVSITTFALTWADDSI